MNGLQMAFAFKHYENLSSFPLPFSSPADPQHTDLHTEQTVTNPASADAPAPARSRGLFPHSACDTGTTVRHFQSDTALLAHPPQQTAGCPAVHTNNCLSQVFAPHSASILFAKAMGRGTLGAAPSTALVTETAPRHSS